MLERAANTSIESTAADSPGRAEWRRLQLDVLSPTICEALNGVYGLGSLSKLHIGPRAIQLSPRWHQQQPMIANPCTISLLIDEDIGELVVPEKLLDRLLADLEPALRLTSLSEELRPILIEYALREALAELEKALGCRLAIEAISPGRQQAAGIGLVTVHMLAELQELGQSSCLLRLPVARIANLSSYLSKFAERRSEAVDLLLPIHVRWGKVELTLAELRSLRPGDILLLDHSCQKQGIALAVIGEHLAVAVELLRTGYRLIGQPRRAVGTGNAWGLDRRRVDPVRLIDAGSIEDVPLTVFLECGQLELDRNTVAELRAGAELPLARPLEAGLDIVAAGVSIGCGELTAIGNAKGVRTTRLSNR